MSVVPTRPNPSRVAGTLSDVRVPLTVPEQLATKLRRLSELECSTIAATTRRLIARGVDRELAALTAEVG